MPDPTGGTSAPTPSHAEAPPGLLPALGWIMGSVFFFYVWVLRVSPSVMVAELMRDFGAGGALLGNLSALYFYTYAGLQVVVGVMVDRFGPRRLMSTAAAVCALGAVVFAVADTVALASLGRLLIGAGAAFGFVGSLTIIARWYPPHRFALLGGIVQMAGMAGGVAGQGPLALAVAATGWRMTVGAVGVFGFAIAVALWLVVRDRGARAEDGPGRHLLAGLRRVVGSRDTWFAGAAGLAATGPAFGFAGLWGVPYIETRYGIDRAAAAAVASLLFAGWALGAPLLGGLSDRIGLRKLPMAAGLAAATAAMAAMIYIPGLPLAGMGVLAFLCGFAASSQILGFALAREHNPTWARGATLGFVNAFVTGGGALYQPAVGGLLDLFWEGRMEAGARLYGVDAYTGALSLIVATGVVGVIFAAFVRETHCRQVG